MIITNEVRREELDSLNVLATQDFLLCIKALSKILIQNLSCCPHKAYYLQDT